MGLIEINQIDCLISKCKLDDDSDLNSLKSPSVANLLNGNKKKVEFIPHSVDVLKKKLVTSGFMVFWTSDYQFGTSAV